MSKEKKSRLNYHEEENAMVENLEDLKKLGKEMEHISEKNDEEKLINRMIHQSLQIHKD